MPVSLSGVMLVEYRVPNGSLNPSPPAYSLPPWRGVADHAVGGMRKIFAALDQARLGQRAGTPVGLASL